MSRITAIFSDIGGVIGTNGWGRAERRRAADQFQLDSLEFEDRHDLVITAFETGHLSLDEYLDRTVFYRPRGFGKPQFREFMFAQSQLYPGTMDLYRSLAGTGRYLLATLNNESLDLNLYRIEKFGLRSAFSVFLSSCFLGMKKPSDAIYRLALSLTQRKPEECLFIDDRALNVERARQCGMAGIHCDDPSRLGSRLREFGLDL